MLGDAENSLVQIDRIGGVINRAITEKRFGERALILTLLSFHSYRRYEQTRDAIRRAGTTDRFTALAHFGGTPIFPRIKRASVTAVSQRPRVYLARV